MYAAASYTKSVIGYHNRRTDTLTAVHLYTTQSLPLMSFPMQGRMHKMHARDNVQ